MNKVSAAEKFESCCRVSGRNLEVSHWKFSPGSIFYAYLVIIYRYLAPLKLPQPTRDVFPPSSSLGPLLVSIVLEAAAAATVLVLYLASA